MTPNNNAGKIRINQLIRVREVRVIDSEGNQLGIMPIEEALLAAVDAGLDLVEISPNAEPPVCKIMDFGRFKYEQTKKQAEAKKKQASFQIKEIKVRPKTSDHDLDVKVNHIIRFLEKKDKVKISLLFRGREVTLSHLGREVLEKVVEKTKDVSIVEQEPKMEGRIMMMVLAPKA